MQRKTVKLTADDQRVFDELQEAAAKCREASPFESTKKKAIKHLVDVFGEEEFGKLPDGRIVQRIPNTRQMPAQPARTNSWSEFKLLAD